MTLDVSAAASLSASRKHEPLILLRGCDNTPAVVPATIHIDDVFDETPALLRERARDDISTAMAAVSWWKRSHLERATPSARRVTRCQAQRLLDEEPEKDCKGQRRRAPMPCGHGAGDVCRVKASEKGGCTQGAHAAAAGRAAAAQKPQVQARPQRSPPRRAALGCPWVRHAHWASSSVTGTERRLSDGDAG